MDRIAKKFENIIIRSALRWSAKFSNVLVRLSIRMVVCVKNYEIVSKFVEYCRLFFWTWCSVMLHWCRVMWMISYCVGLHETARGRHERVVCSAEECWQSVWHLYGSRTSETAAVCSEIWHSVTLYARLLPRLHPQVAQRQTVWKYRHPVSIAMNLCLSRENSELSHAWFPPFHCRVAVLFRCTIAVARENGIGGNVFPLTPLMAFEQWPERWLAVQLRKNGTNRIRSYLLRNSGYGATAAGTATAQLNFSRMQPNSYGAYGILTEFS